MSESAWFDAPREAVRDPNLDDARDLFAPQEGGGEVVLRKSSSVSEEAGAEFLSLLQAAQYAGPRDLRALAAEARRIGDLLGQRAFYAWRAGGSDVSGASIGLAYSLSQVWGRNRTSVILVEESGNRVNLRGRYVDLLTVSVTERDYLAHLSPPPGKFANNRDQSERWRVMQLQSAASKAVRGAILGGLPAWFVEVALQAARGRVAYLATNGKPLPEARSLAIAYLEGFGLSREDLVAFVGAPVELWAVAELSDLRDLGARLKDGTDSVESVRAALAGQSAAAPPPSKAPSAPQSRVASLNLSPKSDATPVQAPARTAAPDPSSTQGSGNATEKRKPGRPRKNPAPEPATESGLPLAPATTTSRTSDLAAVANLEGGLVSGAIRRVRTGLEIGRTATAADLPSDVLADYRAALEEEVALQAEAAAAASEDREPGDDDESALMGED